MKSAAGVMLRYGEVFLKRGRRKYFLNVLNANLERTLARLDGNLKITRPYGRFVVVPRVEGARIEDPDTVAHTLARVFGVVAAEPCELVQEPTFDTLCAAVVDYAQTNRRRVHKTFKIETNRADKRFPKTSIDCNRELGSAVYVALGDIEVDIHTPDLTIGVEIREGLALIYGARIQGVGGLPVGSNGKALLLLSGGIDSPVAGWLTQKRGVAIDCVTFLSPPYTGPQVQAKVETLARLLAKQQRVMKHWTVEIAPLQEHYRDHAPGELLVLLYRRSMVRIAESIANEHRHAALITGDNLGQVASQTLPNLNCIGRVADRPVLRPLLCYDKRETIDLARKIGTYETSIQPYDDCCSLFVPRHPELKGRPSELEHIEARVAPSALEAQALANATEIELR